MEAVTARDRTGLFDDTFRQVIDRGLGFLLDSQVYHDKPYGYGEHSPSCTCGHAGFADPEYGLVETWAFIGMPGESKHRDRSP